MNPENSFSIILFAFSFFTLITGFWFKKYPPKEISWFYGFRTVNSMKSKSHWNFAHTYSGKLFLRYSIILLILGFIGFFIKFDNITGSSIAIPFSVIGAFVVIYKTEKAIIKKFKT